MEISRINKLQTAWNQDNGTYLKFQLSIDAILVFFFLHHSSTFVLLSSIAIASKLQENTHNNLNKHRKCSYFFAANCTEKKKIQYDNRYFFRSSVPLELSLFFAVDSNCKITETSSHYAHARN